MSEDDLRYVLHTFQFDPRVRFVVGAGLVRFFSLPRLPGSLSPLSCIEVSGDPFAVGYLNCNVSFVVFELQSLAYIDDDLGQLIRCQGVGTDGGRYAKLIAYPKYGQRPVLADTERDGIDSLTKIAVARFTKASGL